MAYLGDNRELFRKMRNELSLVLNLPRKGWNQPMMDAHKLVDEILTKGHVTSQDMQQLTKLSENMTAQLANFQGIENKEATTNPIRYFFKQVGYFFSGNNPLKILQQTLASSFSETSLTALQNSYQNAGAPKQAQQPVAVSPIILTRINNPAFSQAIQNRQLDGLSNQERVKKSKELIQQLRDVYPGLTSERKKSAVDLIVRLKNEKDDSMLSKVITEASNFMKENPRPINAKPSEGSTASSDLNTPSASNDGSSRPQA